MFAVTLWWLVYQHGAWRGEARSLEVFMSWRVVVLLFV
jgi:hypothetical protein